MEERFYPQIEWNDNASLEEKIHAVYNILNSISREMYAGRVPQNKEFLEEELSKTKEELEVPLSISFVTMAEAGIIDEVTAAEHTEMFLPWNSNTFYRIGDIRTFAVEAPSETMTGETILVSQLYKCLQDHAAQEGWEPNITPSLWKNLSVAENGIQEWSQPVSSSDAYMTGDEVMYNEKHYKSLIDNNVWSPEAYPQGWELITE